MNMGRSVNKNIELLNGFKWVGEVRPVYDEKFEYF